MEAKIAQIQTDVKNLYRIVEIQEKQNTNLTSLAESVAVMVKEMEYMRNDINDIKCKNELMEKKLEEHRDKDTNKKLDKVEFIEKQIIGWVIVFTLGALVAYFVGK